MTNYANLDQPDPWYVVGRSPSDEIEFVPVRRNESTKCRICHLECHVGLAKETAKGWEHLDCQAMVDRMERKLL